MSRQRRNQEHEEHEVQREDDAGAPEHRQRVRRQTREVTFPMEYTESDETN